MSMWPFGVNSLASAISLERASIMGAGASCVCNRIEKMTLYCVRDNGIFTELIPSDNINCQILPSATNAKVLHTVVIRFILTISPVSAI